MATAEQEPGGINQSQHRWDILEHDYRPNREPQETGEQETRKRDTLQSSTPWFFLSAEKGSWTLSDKWRSCLWKYHVLYCFVQCAFSSRSLLCNILLISQPPPARDGYDNITNHHAQPPGHHPCGMGGGGGGADASNCLRSHRMGGGPVFTVAGWLRTVVSW